MNLIVNVDQNWGIGKDNQLLVHIPEDMKMFRETTTGHVVVMGRNTLESFPGGKPLPKRTNIVLTTNQEYDGKGAIVVHSKDEMLDELKQYQDEDIFIIGGESIYRMMLSYCDVAYVTRVESVFEADTFFPNLDELDEWNIVDQSDKKEHKGVCYSFVKYRKK